MLSTLRTVQKVKSRSCYINVSGLRIHRIPDGCLILCPDPKFLFGTLFALRLSRNS